MAKRDVNSRQARPDGWRATLLAYRPVVDVGRVEQMGAVADLVFDPHGRVVTGILLQRAGPEGTVIEMARRALGGALGLRFVPMEQVLALGGDVVTVDLSRGAAPDTEPASPLPLFSKVVGFAVVTTRGQRIGRLVDLQLDAEGRRIQSYLVAPGGQGVAPQRIADIWARPTANQGEIAQDESAEVEPPAGAPPPAELVVVPATLDVRIGRDLVVIAEAIAPDGQHDAASSKAQALGTDEPTQQPEAAQWEPWEADAPTEQMRN